MQAKHDAVPEVNIDNGKFKYVLIKLYHGDEDEFKYLVRGNVSAEYHMDVYEDTCEKNKGFDMECVGGGRIQHDPEKKTIKVYGYSQGYGRADHSKTVEILKKHYTNYDITFSNEGY